MPRIALIHATPLAIDPIRESFARLWPAARITHLLDDSLSADLAAAGQLNDSMMQRFSTLTRYTHTNGADAILFTCSAFGPAIEAAAREVSVPVLKPNEAMLEEALAAGNRIAIVATFEPTLASMEEELRALAAHAGRPVEPQRIYVPHAMDELARGDGESHDTRIAQSLNTLGGCDVILLAQFSMARAAGKARQLAKPTLLTSPDSAVNKLRAMFN